MRSRQLTLGTASRAGRGSALLRDGVTPEQIAAGSRDSEPRSPPCAPVWAKAELYAAAAGVRLGAVVHIEDVDPESIDGGRYRGHGGSASASEGDLAPGAVVVSAAVVLGFAIAAS